MRRNAKHPPHSHTNELGRQGKRRLFNPKYLSPDDSHEQYLTVKEVAQRYAVSATTIWNWVAERAGFPGPIKLSANTTRWRLNEIVEFERKCLEAR